MAAPAVDFCDQAIQLDRVWDGDRQINYLPGCASRGRQTHGCGPAMLMLQGENPEVPTRPPNPDGSSPVVIYLYVEDVDATVERAVKRGGKLVVPVETHFWGDRIG